jgi:hypothetical protein
MWQADVRIPKKVIKANTHRSRNTGLQLVTVVMRMKQHSIRREMGLSSQLHHITVEGETPDSTYRLSIREEETCDKINPSVVERIWDRQSAFCHRHRFHSLSQVLHIS